MAKDKAYWQVELNGQVFSCWDIIGLIAMLDEEIARSTGFEKAHKEKLREKLQLATMGEAPRYTKLKI